MVGKVRCLLGYTTEVVHTRDERFRTGRAVCMYNVCMYVYIRTCMDGYCFSIIFRSTFVYLFIYMYIFFHAYADSLSLDAIGPWKSLPGDG